MLNENESRANTCNYSPLHTNDTFVADIDFINVGDIIPDRFVQDTIHGNYLGYTYPFTSSSPTRSTVVKFLLKIGELPGILDGSVMVVDIGGNCGFCRSYLPMGKKTSIMFGWEIEGCTKSAENYNFESNSWYAVEQGRIRIASGDNAGKDYVYIKIDGVTVSEFFANPNSRPRRENEIYIEATHSIQVSGSKELRAEYYIDDTLYLNQPAQHGYPAKIPENPKLDGLYFVGWFTQKNGGVLFDFANTALTADIKLYAHFTAETVVASFYPGNGDAIISQTVGKNALVSPPDAPPYFSGRFEYVFVGWKNSATDEWVDFTTERIITDTSYTAQYTEKEYFVSYYANGSLVAKVPFVLSHPTVSGKEPTVPKIANATGTWERHETSGFEKSVTVHAEYAVTVPPADDSILLSAFSGSCICLNTDVIENYLNTDINNQTAFVRSYCAEHQRVFQDFQKTSFSWTDKGENSDYTVYFSDDSSFHKPFIVTANTTSLTNKVGIFVPGKTYYWFVCGNQTGKCSAVDSFTVADKPVRYITAGKVTNMRDLGGFATTENKKVRYGLIYRGASLDEHHSYVNDYSRQVFRHLGMKSEIELREERFHESTGWDMNNSNVFCIVAHGYEDILTLSESERKQYKAAFEAMADIKNYPFYFHCSAGADRTGAFGYIIGGLLGVPYAQLRADYELTSFSEVGLRTADDFLNYSLDNTNQLMIEQYGNGTKNTQIAIQNYLTDFIGVSSAKLKSIQDIMLG